MFERKVLLWKQKTFKNNGINNLDEGGKEVSNAQTAAQHYLETGKERERGGSRN